jgi:hypothetical protein
MLRVYVNSPASTVTIHKDPRCIYWPRADSPGARVIHLREATLSAELQLCREKEYRFAAQSGMNDIWLDVDFADPEFELATVKHVKLLLGKHYKRLREAPVRVHCS